MNTGRNERQNLQKGIIYLNTIMKEGKIIDPKFIIFIKFIKIL